MLTLSKTFPCSWIQKFSDLARFCHLPKSIDFTLLWFKISLLLSIHNYATWFKSSFIYYPICLQSTRTDRECNTVSSAYILIKQFCKNWGRSFMYIEQKEKVLESSPAEHQIGWLGWRTSPFQNVPFVFVL